MQELELQKKKNELFAKIQAGDDSNETLREYYAITRELAKRKSRARK